MKKLLGFAALVAALGSAGEARAQFANHSLGLTVGYLTLDNVSPGLSFGLPIGLTGSVYVENGFEVRAHVGIMVVHNSISGVNVVALDGPSLGARYLFLEENLRPFVGVDLAYLHIFGLGDGNTADFFGLGPNAGLEYFVADSISLGASVHYNLYIALQNGPWSSFGFNLAVNTYF